MMYLEWLVTEVSIICPGNDTVRNRIIKKHDGNEIDCTWTCHKVGGCLHDEYMSRTWAILLNASNWQ